MQLSETQLTDLWERIRTSARKQQQIRKRTLVRRLSVAASILLALASGFYLTNRSPKSAPAIPIIGERFPEQEIRLHAGQEVVALARDAEIVVDNKGRISIANEQIPIASPIRKNNKLVVPYGKRATLTLADGTKVWLNSGTELEFPGEFTGRTRDISVSGEIYLEVAKIPTTLSMSMPMGSTLRYWGLHSTFQHMPTARNARWFWFRARLPSRPKTANRWK